MIIGSIRTVPLGLAALAAMTAAAAADGGPAGVWLDAAGRGAVEIAPCGEGAALCGRVVWVKAADQQKRCGEQILGSLTKGGNGTWGGGWIYSPDRGRKFDVEIKQVGADKLRILGWAGVRMFSETHYWKRAAPDLVRCGTEQIAAGQAEADVVAAASPPLTPSADAAPLPLPAPLPAPVVGQADKPAAKAGADTEKRASRGGGSSGLPPQVEKYFKRSADGTCKVDTPWIKVKFDCKKL